MTPREPENQNAIAGVLLASVLSVAGLISLLAVSANGQASSKSVHEIVESLLRQVAAGDRGFLSCGETDELKQERATAQELAGIGKAALPDIEQALDSIEAKGSDSRFFPASGWFLLTYARAAGPGAIPRLKRIGASSRLASLRLNVDAAIALSLGLTSYISSSRAGGVRVACRRGEPRDVLDKLILSFERGDRPQLESSLGPDARAALDALLRGRSWEAFRAEIWHARPGAMVAMGYQFDIAGRWSEPEETLQEQKNYGNAPLAAENVRLNVLLKNSSGDDCGKQGVDFRKIDAPTGALYLVNSADLGDLLRSIAFCTSR
jgi:hypothetical protein